MANNLKTLEKPSKRSTNMDEAVLEYYQRRLEAKDVLNIAEVEATKVIETLEQVNQIKHTRWFDPILALFRG